MSFSAKSYSFPSEENNKKNNTAKIFEEKTQLVFHHLFDHPYLLSEASAKELKELIATINKLSPNQEFTNAAFQLIQYQIYHHFQMGEWNLDMCNSLLAFPNKFHKDFLRAPNKALYFILLQQHCINNYKHQFYNNIKQNQIQPHFKNGQQTDIDAIFSFFKNQNSEQKVLLCSNMLLYKDDQFAYGVEPVFRAEYHGAIYLCNVTNKVEFVVEERGTPCSYYYNLNSSGSGSEGLKDEYQNYKNIEQPFHKLTSLKNNSDSYRTYASPNLIIVTDNSSHILNIYKIKKNSAIPLNLNLKSIELGKNQIKFIGLTEDATYQFVSYLKEIESVGIISNIFTTKDNWKSDNSCLTLSLAFDQEYKIGEHVINNADDILKIKSIAGNEISEIEAIMKSSDSKYSSGGFIGDNDNLLDVLKEDYEKLEIFNLTCKQIGTLLTHIINEFEAHRSNIIINGKNFELSGGIAANLSELPENRRGRCMWTRSEGIVCSPFDKKPLLTDDVSLYQENMPMESKFGFSSCLAPLIGEFGFCERGIYYFDLDKFVKLLNLDKLYYTQLTQPYERSQEEAQVKMANEKFYENETLGSLSVFSHSHVCENIPEILNLRSPELIENSNNEFDKEISNQEKALQEIKLLLHDGSKSKNPTLTKDLLSHNINSLPFLDQISLLGQIFSLIQSKILVQYRHVKIYFLEKSGRDIANDQIKILKDMLVSIVKSHPNDDSLLKKMIANNNEVKNLIDFDRTQSRINHKDEPPTNCRKELNKLLSKKDLIKSIGYKQ